MITLVWFYVALYYAFNAGVVTMMRFDLEYLSLNRVQRIKCTIFALLFGLPIMLWSLYYVNSEVKRQLDEMDK